MTDTERLQRLQQFFSGYFHEDWDVDAHDWTAVVDDFMRKATDSNVARLGEDVAWLSASGNVERLLFEQLGCYYDPQADGLNIREWLCAVADRLKARATSP